MSHNISRRSFLGFGLLVGGCTALPVPGGLKTDPWQRAADIRNSISEPNIPGRVFNVKDYGAIGDGEFMNSGAFADAIAACSAAGGGRVVVPSGQYLTGPIHLRSNIDLHIESGAVVLFSTDPADYPLVFSRYEGMELYNYSPLIYARNAQNVAVTGAGVLHGQAADENWWSWCGSPLYGWSEGMPRQHEDRDKLFAQAEAGVPVGQRVYGQGHYLRPSLMEFYECQNVMVEGVHLKDSPFWNIHPVLCRDVIVREVTVTGYGPNNDGCNPESVDRMLIDNCYFDTGDDCIAIKSGRNADGRRLATPSRNIVINGCQMRAGHGGVVIGSEISGGVHHVFAENCQMDSPDLWYALRFKNNAMRGGKVEHIYARDIDVGQVTYAAITCDFNYEEGADGPFIPELNNLVVERLNVKQAGRVIDSQGLPGAPVRNIQLIDCNFDGVTAPSIVTHTRGLVLDNVTVNGELVSSL